MLILYFAPGRDAVMHLYNYVDRIRFQNFVFFIIFPAGMVISKNNVPYC